MNNTNIDFNVNENSDDNVLEASTEIKTQKPKKKLTKKQKILILIFILLGATAATGITLYFVLNQPREEVSTAPEETPVPEPVHYYSKLSGEEIQSEAENNQPIFCIQTPNGVDGARPQVGLKEAKVVYEAIAEAGITRFAAIYQNPQSSILGPIRSLRMYYLEWDTPYDCTIVHAGGADDAIQAVSNGEYHHLSESVTYMWRNYTNYRAPNNLFTSPALLTAFNTDNGYSTSSAKFIPRLTPQESSTIVTKNQEKAQTYAEYIAQNEQSPQETTESEAPENFHLTTNITVNFGYIPNFNLIYTYNQATNTYDRAYAGTSGAHMTYTCPTNLNGEDINIERDCIISQLSPSAVAVIKVQEGIAWDNYHEDIVTSGSGEAYIFQNGAAIPATWHKADKYAQISFTDNSTGEEIKIAPGQLWISAIPISVGGVTYN